MAGALRRAKGFSRFAVSVQYHGGSFLGFTYQGSQREDSLVEQRKKNGKLGTVDLRGHRSVEGRLREALDDLFGKGQWENIQASSRTDRGVHALKNTFHVDIQMANKNMNVVDNVGVVDDDAKENNNGNASAKHLQQPFQHDPREAEKIERKLKDGLNFYLSRQSHGFGTSANNHKHPKAKQNPMMNELRILNARKSPESMDNPYALTEEGKAQNQPHRVDWNARFSATQRTYVYRILCYCPRKEQQEEHSADGSSNNDDENGDPAAQNHFDGSYGIPFEWDRAWCLPLSHTHPLDVDSMKEAAKYLVGTHDFSSFRGSLCQRNTPIVTMKSATIREFPASGEFRGEQQQQQSQKLVTITFVANSFLYRQVRNMVGCLVEVGKHGGRLSPKDVKELLAVDWNNGTTQGENITRNSYYGTKFKHRPYSTAPPQGLFLLDVQHGNFRF